MRRPLVVLAAAYAAGIFLESSCPLSHQVLTWAAACICAAALACAYMRRLKAGSAAVVVLAVMFGALGYAPFTVTPLRVQQLEQWLNRPVAVEAEVERAEPLAAGALRLRLRYDSIETAEKQFLGEGRLQVTLHKPSRYYSYGQRLRLTCRLRRPRNFSNPGGFDYKRFLAHRGIYLTAALNDDRTILILRENGGSAPMRALERYRSRLRRLINRRLAPPKRDIVLALLLGEKQTLDKTIQKQFARLGAAHLLAISGLHIGIVAALAFGFACFLLRRRPRLLLYVELWRTAALAALVPVCIYCCVAGLQIPTLRSGIMIAACTACLLLKRRQDVLNALALAGCCILVWMPSSLFEISFQLSFIAVLCLILYAPYVQRLFALLEGIGPGRPRTPFLYLFRFLGGILAASAVATAATAPLAARYFHQCSLAGIPANCVLVPAVGFGAVPCALGSALLLPLSETAAAGLLHMAGLILDQTLLWTAFWSQARIAAMQVPPPTAAELTAWYAGILCLPLCLHRRRRLCALLLCAALAALLLWLPGAGPDGLLRVTFLDVGHGDAAVIRFPQGRAMLIDSGGLRSERFDTGASIVVPALHAMGIHDLGWLVITHPHHDHMAGMNAVLQWFRPDELWVPDDTCPDPLLASILENARRRRTIIRTPSCETPALVVNNAMIEILSPAAQQAAAARTYHELNDSSLVIRISYGGHAFLFTGDIGAQQERFLAHRPANIRAQVLKVPHHGKRGSSTAAFLDAVAPCLAVFSCRPPAGRDLPADVLSRYRQRAVQQLRTDKHGAVQVVSNGTRLEISTFLPQGTFTPCVPNRHATGTAPPLPPSVPLIH